MACTVSQKDIREEIGKQLISSFPSAKRTSYQDRLSILIPYDANNSKNVLYGQAKKLQNKYNKDYHASTYGNVISFTQLSSGVEFSIHPTKKLADSMTEQNEVDELATVQKITGDYTFQGETYFSMEDMNAAIQASMNDFVFMPSSVEYNPTNYNDYINHKKNLLQSVTNRLNNNVANRKFNKSTELRVDISDLNKLKETLEQEIYDLINAEDIYSKTLSIFNTDLEYIDKVLKSSIPTVENIQYAEDMINYFDIISNYSTTNHLNQFVQTGDSSTIEPDVLDILNSLRQKISDQKTKVNSAKRQYLLQAIGESENLKGLYPDMQLEEIRDKLLSAKSDIGIASMLFATVDKEFGGQDSAIAQLIRLELENTRNRMKPQATKLIQEINNIQGRVKTKLLDKGHGISFGPINKLTSEVSYDLFYQKTSNGNKTDKLINKFSGKWFKDVSSFMRTNAEESSEAWKTKDFEAVNKALVNRYNWLKDRTDFIEIGRLPEIINNPAFTNFNQFFNPGESLNYKQELIGKIGQYNYNKLVETQKESLEDFILSLSNEKTYLMDIYGVTNFDALDEGVKAHYGIFEKRNNPFEFLTSHNSGQEGRIDFVMGQTGNQYQSHLKYNSYIPKQQVTTYNSVGESRIEDSGYFDSNFSEIENDADLLKFWEILAEATQYMNSTLSDSKTTLSHNSLLKMSKGMTDTLLDKRLDILNKTTSLLSDTGQTIKDMMSTNIRDTKANDITDVNKAGIQTIQDEVANRYKMFEMQFKRVSKVDNVSSINPRTLNQESQDLLERLTGLNVSEIISAYGNKVNIPFLAKEVLTNQVMEDQTFNLPVMMRAYLDVVSEYKAQKEALPKINIYKDLYDTVQLEKAEVKSGIYAEIRGVANRILLKQREYGLQDKRVRGQLRTQSWINKNVKGVEDKDYWGKMGKNLNSGEKAYKQEAEQYITYLERKIEETIDNDKAIALQHEIGEIKYQIDNLGMTYTWASIYNTLINRFGIFLGLGWNVPSQFFNRFQGWYQGMINDTGRYWTAGNFYAANAFVNRKGVRYIPGMNSYRNEVKKAKLLTEKMGYIQDNTNELDRARRESGFTGWTRKFNPFYLTEYTEWHNQVPQALSILMDSTIKSTSVDAQGNAIHVPIFDGHNQTFPAYNIVDGELVLKSEFRTPENIETWENFNSNAYTDVKSKITDTIALLNGDYSKTGSTYIKNYTLGKSLMMFKTWMPNQYFLRFAKNQSSVSLGLQDFDGSYAGALSNKKTNIGSTAALGLNIGITSTMTLGLGLGGITLLGLAAYSYKMNKSNKNVDGESLQAMTQLSAVGKAILKKSIGLPVNIVSGRNLIKAHDFNELNISDSDRQNLQFIINEVVGLLWLTLGKVLIKSLMGDDDEKEPKTLDGETPNPYYGQGEKDKTYYNILENSVTRLIEDASMFTNAQGMYSAISKPAGIDSWFTRIAQFSDGLQKKLITDDDTLQTGENAGESKLWKSVGKLTMPGIFNEWSGGDFKSFGFSKYGEREWKPGEVMDAAFWSDYKKDLKSLKSDRAKAKTELTEYWEKEYDIDNADPAVKVLLEAEISKLVKAELEATYSLKIRTLYDEEQNEIE
jgi:hypothetical protein